MTDQERLRGILAERRARKAAEEAAKKAVEAPVASDFAEDLIPEEQFERSEEDREMDQIIANIDIIRAYERWCGKMTPVVKGRQRENIMISCPNPAHPDKNPSAWVNLDKQTWFCGGCQEGGDAHDIAAMHFGIVDYKSGANFHKLRRQMAEDFGYTFTTTIAGSTLITPPPEAEYIESDIPDESDKSDTSDTPVRSLAVVPDPEPAEVVALPGNEIDESEEIDFPSLDWRSFLPADTFLRTYMECTSINDAPEEYHFWNAMIALGLTLGRDVTLIDQDAPVFGNLFVCVIGRTGSGKSRSTTHLFRLLRQALPYDESDPATRGVLRVDSPGSGEHLVREFEKPVYDPADPKRIAFYAPVKGIITYDELAGLAGRAARNDGEVLTSYLQRFCDMPDVVSTGAVTTGRKKAENPFASALTSTQPKSVRTLLGRGQLSSGFINRWIFVGGKPKERIHFSKVTVNIDPAVNELKKIKGWAATFPHDEQILLADDAQKISIEFLRRVEKDKEINYDLLARLDLLFKKLILLLAANRMEKVASHETIEQAITCYRYLLECYMIPAGEIGNTLEREVEDYILRTLKKNKDGMTANMIARLLKHRNYPRKMIVNGLKVLAQLGQVEEAPSPKGTRGRPTVYYKLVS